MRKMLEKAQDVAPDSYRLHLAGIDLERGEQYMREARYGRASRHFSRVKRASEAILNSREEDAEFPVQKPELELEKMREAAKASQNGSGQEESRDGEKRMGLPEQVLAQYLAEKRVLEEQESGETESQQAGSSEQETEEQQVVEMSAEPEVQDPPIDPRDLEPSGLVEPSEEESDSESQDLPSPEEAEQAEPERRRASGEIVFDQQTANLDQAAMALLDQMAVFLIENPSHTLSLLGVHMAEESPSLIDARFESIQSYLVDKGVAEDQVRLDTDQRTGERAEFEMYLIEH